MIVIYITCPSQVGVGIDKSEKEKCLKYGEAADTNGLNFIPLVLEVYGKWSKKMTTFVKQLVKMIAESDPGGPPMSVLIGYWRKRLSSVLQRYNAVTLIGRFARACSNNSGSDCQFDESNNPVIVGTRNV